jgi:hypothetical protein
MPSRLLWGLASGKNQASFWADENTPKKIGSGREAIRRFTHLYVRPWVEDFSNNNIAGI